MLTSIHNVHFYMTLTANARAAILKNDFSEFKREFYRGYLGRETVEDVTPPQLA